MPRAVLASGRIWAVARDGSLRYADPDDPSEWKETEALPSPVITLASCQDRASVFAACRDRSLHLFNAHTCALVLSNSTSLHDVPLCILPLPMENALFVGLQDGSVVRCHLASFAFDCIVGCGIEHSNAVNALDADDQYLYSGGEDGLVLVWNLKEGNAVREISMPSAPVRSLLRVDAALWAGLANGSVEVFDIFGDNSSGIDRTASKTPHAGAVTDLVKVGEKEVWSLAGASGHAGISLDDSPSVAVWDTRDLSYSLTPSVQERDLMSVTVVDRVAFEEVTILTLTNELGWHFVSKTVKGSYSPSPSETGSDNYHILISDLEERLIQANEELHFIKSSPSYQKAVEDDQSDNDMPSLLISSPEMRSLAEHRFNDGMGTVGDYSQVHQNGSFNPSPALADNDGDMFTIPRTTSDTLLTSLRRISELLVTLLTEDVLSPKEGHTRGSSDELRTAVATITRELNMGRQLVEACATSRSDNSVVTVDENDSARNVRDKKSICCETAAVVLRKQLAKEMETLGRDLAVVTTERDFFADDLNQTKRQSEATMASLQGLLREETSKVAAKDDLIAKMRSEAKLEKSNFQNELEHLVRLGESVSKDCQGHLDAAYDKTERQDIEIQALKDSIHGLNTRMKSVLSTNQCLEEKCMSLENKLSERSADLSNSRKDIELESHRAKQVIEEETSRLQEEHESKLHAMRAEHDEVVSRLESRIDNFAREDRRKEVNLEKLKNDLDDVASDLGKERAKLEGLRDSLQKKTSEVEGKNFRIGELERSVAALETTNGASSTFPVEQHGGAGSVRNEVSVLKEELNHRMAAAKLYEEEADRRDMAVSNFKAAVGKLQTALSVAENDIEVLKHELHEAKEAMAAKDVYILLLERGRERKIGILSDSTGIEDSSLATAALLASANGEIEQMSNQLEAMHVAHMQQERELAELRTALSFIEENNVRAAVADTKTTPGVSGSDLQTKAVSFYRDPIPDGGRRPDVSPNNFASEEVLVNDTLQEVQDGMATTQRKLRELSSTARRYRKSAQAHLDALPVLFELEGELVRVSQEDGKKASRLKSARGILQSVIAQYFSSSEKRAVLRDYDERAYAPSARRLDALERVTLQMRSLRTGSLQLPEARPLEGETEQSESRLLFQSGGRQQEVLSPRRLLTY